MSRFTQMKKERRVSAPFSAAALAFLVAATLSPTVENIPRGTPGENNVEAQSPVKTNDAGTSRAPTSAQQLGQFEGDGKNRKRVRLQAYNRLKQIRRRMEKAGLVTSGRQWRLLLREVNRQRVAEHRATAAGRNLIAAIARDSGGRVQLLSELPRESAA